MKKSVAHLVPFIEKEKEKLGTIKSMEKFDGYCKGDVHDIEKYCGVVLLVTVMILLILG